MHNVATRQPCGTVSLPLCRRATRRSHMAVSSRDDTTVQDCLKPGFHYPSWRPELTARVDGWPVYITRQHGPCWRLMETGHPSTRAVNSGSGNRALLKAIEWSTLVMHYWVAGLQLFIFLSVHCSQSHVLSHSEKCILANIFSLLFDLFADHNFAHNVAKIIT